MGARGRMVGIEVGRPGRTLAARSAWKGRPMIDASMDGGPASDAGGPTCVPHDGSYTCLGGTWPVCPSTAQGERPCDDSVPSCMGCDEGAGFTCSCQDAGLVPYQDAALWGCIGTEYTCE